MQDTAQEEVNENVPTLKNYKFKIIWFNVMALASIHLLGLYGLYLMIMEAQYKTILWMWLIMLFSALGVQCGAHRLWSHRAFKAKTPLKVILMLLDTMAGQTPIWDWSRDHRVHHKFSETDADPHNANRGFFFSHCGWLMCNKHPDVRTKGKGVFLDDLKMDEVVMFQKKYYYPLLFTMWAFVPTVVPCYFWSESLNCSFFVTVFLRYSILLNIIWSVNSVAHLWGYKPYDKHIGPVEAYTKHLINGEGYHNYHHVFPWDYSASEFGSMHLYNGATFFIDMFAQIGWAYDLRKASKQMIQMKKERSGLPDCQYGSPASEMIKGFLIASSPILACVIARYISKTYLQN